MYVVVSDLHIGNRNSVFSSSESYKIVNQFIKELNEIGSVEKLIILGDIFDFWDESLFNVLEKSTFFLEKISEISKDILYIPGNHDHHVLILCEEMENIENLEKGFKPTFQDILMYEYPRINPDFKEAKFLRGLLLGADIHIQLLYPEYTCNWKGKEILFRHGHYFDSGLFSVMPCIFEKFGGKIANEMDFEIVNTPIYEALYRCGEIKEINRILRKLHKIYKCTECLYKKESHKDIKSRQKDIETFFKKFKHNSGNRFPDIFIFGHTHIADRGSMRSDIINYMELFNSGCWVKEGIDHYNTYITIDDEIAVREVGKGKIF
jgi:UDP-2,3-diacylglucosamine pyrophosphatase LpxH